AGGMVECTDALAFLAGTVEAADVVFLDPPFGAELLPATARALSARGWLRRDARIYVEAPARAGPPSVPEEFVPLKAKRAGEVGYHLYAYDPARAADQP